MQRAVYSQWMHKHATIIFLLISLALLSGLVAGFASHYFWVALLPVAGLAAALFTLKPDWLYFSLLVLMPLSIEFEIGSFGTDLPSEPLLIGLAGLSFFWLIRRHSAELKELLLHPFTLVLALHLIWAFICILPSQNPTVSLKYALAKSWYIGGAFTGSYWIIRQFSQLKLSLWLLIFSTCASIAFVMYEHYWDGFTFDSIGAACNPLYRNHVIYGVFMVMILPFMVYLRPITAKGSLIRLCLDIMLILLLAGTYFSYTRGAWLAIPVMIAMYWGIRWKLLRWFYPLGVIAGFLFFIFLASDYKYLHYAPNYEQTIYHDELGDHISATFEGKDMSTMERFHRWIAAFRMSKEYPVFGVGANNFVDLYKPYTVSDFETYISDNEERSTVHNYFILMLVEQGYPGLFITLLLVGIFFIYAEKAYARFTDPAYRNFYMACILCSTSFWLNNLFSDLLEANKLAPLWFMCMAWMMRLEQWDKKTASV